MRWSEFATCQSTLAAVAHEQLIGPGVVLIGTTRCDGSAGISGVEPLIMDGELWLSMMPTSTKARDLYRDPRILLHSSVASPAPQAEVMVRGTVRADNTAEVQRRYAAAAEARLGWRPVPGEFTLFAVDISNVTYIGHDAETMPSMWSAGPLARSTFARSGHRPPLAPLSQFAGCSPKPGQPDHVAVMSRRPEHPLIPYGCPHSCML